MHALLNKQNTFQYSVKPINNLFTTVCLSTVYILICLSAFLPVIFICFPIYMGLKCIKIYAVADTVLMSKTT